jgi:phospholipid/cholesterol/gamma-HCH transport system substrate-binding protein
METRANFVLIGAFTVAGILGVLGFFIWLAKYQVDRKYDYYDIFFSDVSGLSQAADVRFNGLSVGSVVDLELAEDDPSLVRVRIEIRDGTPVKSDTKVQLQVLGVTGVSYVSLSGGSPSAPPLEAEDGRIPQFRAQRSIVEKLTEDAPDLLSEGVGLLQDLRGFASSVNRDYITDILKNVDQASGQLDAAITDFSAISGTVAKATDQISRFTENLAPVAASVRNTLDRSEAMIDAATGAFAEAQTTLKSAAVTLDTARTALNDASGLIQGDAAKTLSDISATAVELRASLDRIGQETSGVLSDFGTTAQRATQRLDQLETTLASIDEVMKEADVALESVDSASIAFEDLVEGDGAELVTETREAVALADHALTAINGVLDTDMPAVISDVRNAVETVDTVVAQAGSDLTTFSGQLAPLSSSAEATMQAAIGTLHNANRTLTELDDAIATAERTLTAAETTINNIDGVVVDEARPAAAEIRATAERFGNAVEEISQDLPIASADLRAAIGEARAVMGRINGVVQGAAGPVTGFTEKGLPEFTIVARQMRELVDRLDRIAARLERDPARFILGSEAPDYRR